MLVEIKDRATFWTASGTQATNNKVAVGTQAGNVKLVVYDISGKEVNVMQNGILPAGKHKMYFNAGRLASGVYFYKLESGSFVSVKRMTVIK